MIKSWFKSGNPWVWFTASAVSACLIMVVGVLGLILVRGIGNFWPGGLVQFSYQEDGGQVHEVIGELIDTSITPAAMAKVAGFAMADGEDVLVQYQIKTGNRDVSGSDFRWIQERRIKRQSTPPELIAVERREWGNFYGRLVAVKESGKMIAEGPEAMPVLQERLEAALDIFDKISYLEKKKIGAVNYGLERLRLERRKLELEKRWDADAQQRIAAERAVLDGEYKKFQTELMALYRDIRKDSFVAAADDGSEHEIALAKVVRVYQPNEMNVFGKIGHYFTKFAEFLADDPREANTEGGIFPAIYGTILMVIVMSIIVTPFGVIAAVYLREYAKQGFTTRLIRIAVNNLAGVPSVVYGVFGLGFFVYILGGKIDRLFYPEAAPAPVFGTPGLMWASITLALLTLPVVIVSTEEGLARIPKSIREGSLALGATKFETLWRTVLPMASPAMMTGLILAVARAAGEVAPLMLVGVVKLAPSLPLDGNFPFLHLERKFMHLGFHIYDVGFQSPNVEAARPLVYATSLLLVLVIIGLNLSAILIRNHLREKYRALEG
ncbi:phosphate ABC transporter permease PstA [Candidatus Methylomicrobium oryzae]|jgi:phosphate transport system permease protein|uniref:phosphate ABC transporter permease PstA n=1 Tax=Candidatus Methylomicrobium oryzae TaxID=2802053 RepID=UPI001920A0F6|nr:phosphate ABC transporter permease PstA [Methylomicrobium sp. RS1]MBL1262195.1 phosphate ABC transporter permease PstA [Methylomicrobium sp. RS1]